MRHGLLCYLALTIGVLCISTTAIFTKWAAGPVAVWRMIIAAAIGPAAVAPRAVDPTAARCTGHHGRPLVCRQPGHVELGADLTSAATATLLDNTAPVWVGLETLVLFRERLRHGLLAGLTLALSGSAVVTGFNPAGGFRQPGDVLAFAGALFYAGYLLNTQRAAISTGYRTSASLRRLRPWPCSSSVPSWACPDGLPATELCGDGRGGAAGAGGQVAAHQLRWATSQLRPRWSCSWRNRLSPDCSRSRCSARR